MGGAVTKASPFGRGGSRKADGEGAHDGFWIVTFDYVGKKFAVHQAFSSGKKSSHQGARDEVSKIVVLPRNTSSASFLGTFSHWRRLFVSAHRLFTRSRGGTRIVCKRAVEGASPYRLRRNVHLRSAVGVTVTPVGANCVRPFTFPFWEGNPFLRIVSFVDSRGGAVAKASPFGRGGSRKADGEGVCDGFLIVAFGCVNKRFAVHQAFSSGRRGTACGG